MLFNLFCSYSIKDEIIIINVYSCRLKSAYSKSGKYFCVVRDIVSGKESKQYLEVWADYLLVKNYDLSALDVHGKIYADG